MFGVKAQFFDSVSDCIVKLFVFFQLLLIQSNHYILKLCLVKLKYLFGLIDLVVNLVHVCFDLVIHLKVGLDVNFLEIGAKITQLFYWQTHTTSHKGAKVFKHLILNLLVQFAFDVLQEAFNQQFLPFECLVLPDAIQVDKVSMEIVLNLVLAVEIDQTYLREALLLVLTQIALREVFITITNIWRHSCRWSLLFQGWWTEANSPVGRICQHTYSLSIVESIRYWVPCLLKAINHFTTCSKFSNSNATPSANRLTIQASPLVWFLIINQDVFHDEILVCKIVYLRQGRSLWFEVIAGADAT